MQTVKQNVLLDMMKQLRRYAFSAVCPVQTWETVDGPVSYTHLTLPTKAEV